MGGHEGLRAWPIGASQPQAGGERAVCRCSGGGGGFLSTPTFAPSLYRDSVQDGSILPED